MVDVRKRNILKYARILTCKYITFFVSVILASAFILVSAEDFKQYLPYSIGKKILIAIGLVLTIFIALLLILYVYCWLATKTEVNVFGKNEIIGAVLEIENISKKGYYAYKQIEYIKSAKRRVRVIMHSLNDENANKIYKDIDELLRKTHLDKEVDVKVLAPHDSNCTIGAYQISVYHQVPIKLSYQMNKGSIRFAMIDDHKIVFSVANPMNPKLSRQYVEVDSYELGKALTIYFNDVWDNNSSDFKKFIAECLHQNYGKNIDFDIAQEEFKVPKKLLQEYVK